LKPLGIEPAVIVNAGVGPTDTRMSDAIRNWFGKTKDVKEGVNGKPITGQVLCLVVPTLFPIVKFSAGNAIN